VISDVVQTLKNLIVCMTFDDFDICAFFNSAQCLHSLQQSMLDFNCVHLWIDSDFIKDPDSVTFCIILNPHGQRSLNSTIDFSYNNFELRLLLQVKMFKLILQFCPIFRIEERTKFSRWLCFLLSLRLRLKLLKRDIACIGLLEKSNRDSSWWNFFKSILLLFKVTNGIPNSNFFIICFPFVFWLRNSVWSFIFI